MSLTQAARAFTEALLGDDPVALYDNAPCGYLTALPDGTVIKVNQTFLTIAGYDAQDVLSRRLVELVTAGARIFYETHLVPLLGLQGSVREIALDLVRGDGSRLPVLLNASVERGVDGAPRLIRFAVFEATERRRYEQELLRATEVAQQAQRDAEDAERRSRAMVDTLQSTLVPRTLPAVAGLRLAGAYRPAGDGAEVGGDFYDAFDAFGSHWLILGDVSGKGVEAAVVTALVRNGARALVLSLLEHRREPAEILRMLDHLVNHHETERFCTAAILRLSPAEEGWRLSYASGGHPPAVRRSADGTTTFLTATGPALGLSIDGEFEQHETDLAHGDTLLLYTDGVTEARVRNELYGDERLCRAVASGSGATAVVEAVLRDVMQFNDSFLSDDLACLAVSPS